MPISHLRLNLGVIGTDDNEVRRDLEALWLHLDTCVHMRMSHTFLND